MYSTQSRAALLKAVQRKHRIAIAFNTKGISRDSLAVPVGFANFDNTDLRHLDGPVIGALKRKGSSIEERDADNTRSDSFFVTAANLDQFKDIIAIG